MTIKSCDSMSYELAAHFLHTFPNTPHDVIMQLALVIQSAAEEWLAFDDASPEHQQLKAEKPTCLTPGNCILPHGWLRAFCPRCQATKEPV